MSVSVHNTALVASGIAASRLLGFARDLLAAHLLGPAADAFLLAFRIPNVFRRMLAEGSLGLAHGVVLSAEAPGEGMERLGQRLCAGAALLGCGLAALLWLTAEPLFFALAPGRDAAFRDHGIFLFRLLLLYLPFCFCAAVAFAYAAALGRFAPQALSSFSFNAAALAFACCGLLPFWSGPATVELLLCSGVLAGGLLQVFLGLKGSGLPLRPAAERLFGLFRGARERALLLAAPQAALGASAHQLHILAGVAFASALGPGGISAMYFAERLVELPLGIAGAAVGIAALPELARLAASGEPGRFAGETGAAVRLGAFFSLPAAAGLYALAGPMCGVLFGHGLFGPETVAATAQTLSGYAIGLPALCAARPLLAAANALGASRATLIISLGSVAALVPVCAAGILAARGEERFFFLGAGLAAAAWAQAAALGLLARRRLGRDWLGPILPHCVLYALCAALMGLLLAGPAALEARQASLGAAARLVLLAAACATAWVGLFALAGNKDARMVWAQFSGRKKQTP